jgi:hypothetical protein
MGVFKTSAINDRTERIVVFNKGLYEETRKVVGKRGFSFLINQLLLEWHKKREAESASTKK